MTLHPPISLWPAPPWPGAGLRAAAATPAAHLVCDLHGQVCWADELADALLGEARVLLRQDDGRLGVRSHRLGLLALRSAMRIACLGAPPVPVTLRHGADVLQVGVHALPETDDGDQRVLLSLRVQLPPATD